VLLKIEIERQKLLAVEKKRFEEPALQFYERMFGMKISPVKSIVD
jgi:hypothetical protein